MEQYGTRSVMHSYEAVEMRREENAPLYEAVRARVKEGPLTHSDLFHALGAVSRVQGDVRALLYDMAANNAAGLGPEVGATYYLHVGCLYDASTTADQDAREQCRNTIVQPVMHRLQSVLDDLPRGAWKSEDREFYRSLASPLRDAANAWRSLDYPFADQTISTQALTHTLYAEIARLSHDRPVWHQEIVALMKLYGYHKASPYNFFYSLRHDTAFQNWAGVARYFRTTDAGEQYLYNPAQSQGLVDQLAAACPDLALLQEQRKRLAGGIEQKMRTYLAKEYSEAELHMLYGDAQSNIE